MLVICLYRRGEWRREIIINYHGKCSNGAVDDKISHVADQVGSEANVEKHVEDGENLLARILCMEVAVSSCWEGDNWPVHGIGVSYPHTYILKILNLSSNPCVIHYTIMRSQPEVEATRNVYSKQRHL